MTKRIRIAERTVQRIQTNEPTVRRLDPDGIARALGGEPLPESIEGKPGPISLYVLRTEMLRRRQSSGGRPGIEGTSFRPKIPVGQQEWHCLEAIAASLSVEGFSPSPGQQVASVLLSIALRSVTAESQTGTPQTMGYAELLAKQLASQHPDDGMDR